jgi:argininosuccinate lyase
MRLTEAQLPWLETHRTDTLGPSLFAIHAFDKAHLVMLAERGIVEPEHVAAMLTALRDMEREGTAKARAEVGGGMHSGEHYLIGRLGEAIGGRVHTGRSSGDLIEVARRMTIRGYVLDILDGLTAVRGALVGLGLANLESVMPGYSHGQHAQPTTLGHWAAMFQVAFSRDHDRLRSCYRRLNLSPAGAAILTGSDFPLDRELVATLLGFDAPLRNTMDAIMSHDLEMEVASALTVLAATIARLADDLILWSTAEFAFVDLPDRFCGTSSIMPQKKNPDGLELMKSAAGQALAGLVGAVIAERGPTGFPILERRHTQDTLWAVGALVGQHLTGLADLLMSMRVDAARMAAAAGEHWAQVTDLSSALVRVCGIDWRSAHQTVALLVRRATESGRSPAQVTPEELDAAAGEVVGHPVGLGAADFAAAMDPRAFVRRRTLLGGPAPDQVCAELTRARTEINDAREEVRVLRDAVASAERELERRVDALVGAPSGGATAGGVGR